MPRIKGTTSTMNTFLRAFREHPAGPPPEQWPTPAILRRWLRRPAFQRALVSLRKVLQFRAEFHLAAAAANAAQSLHATPTQDSELSTQDSRCHKRLIDLLRLSHLRQRFPIEDPDFRIPSQYDDDDGERLYSIDELDDDFKPVRPSPNIGPKHQRAPFAAYQASARRGPAEPAAHGSAPQPPDPNPKNG
jgi:hypothetical protein